MDPQSDKRKLHVETFLPNTLFAANNPWLVHVPQQYLLKSDIHIKPKSYKIELLGELVI